MPVRHLGHLLLGLLLATRCVPAAAAFDLQFAPLDETSGFTVTQRALLQDAVDQAEAMWETVLLDYQEAVSFSSVPIQIRPTTGGLASATFDGTTSIGEYSVVYATGGYVNINVNEIENFADWQGPGANGLNFLDELIAHEIGHVLGIGTLWTTNGVYVNNSYQYTGQHGLAAYQNEFDENATFVPVENRAANPGTVNAHWDQMMRSSGEAGDPNGPGGPWVLSPLTGVVDQYGRDRAFELMTGAIDPDYFEPFLSRTTIESMRDMGYIVAELGDLNGDGRVSNLDANLILDNLGLTGLQIDSMRYGDLNGDRSVTMDDYTMWQLSAGIPEPSAIVLTGLALAAVAWRRSR